MIGIKKFVREKTEMLCFSKLWMKIPKNEFRILVAIVYSAKEGNTFVGKLKEFSDLWGLKWCNYSAIKEGLAGLAEKEIILYSEDKKTYTITILGEIDKDNLLCLPKTWVWLAMRSVKGNNVAWETVVKLWLFVCPDQIYTNKEIGEELGVSPDAIGRAIKVLVEIEALVTKNRYWKIGENTFCRIGKEITPCAWLSATIEEKMVENLKNEF